MKNIIIILITLLFVNVARAQVLLASGSQEETGTIVVANKNSVSGKTEVTGIMNSKSGSDCFETIDDLFIARDKNIQVESGQSKTYVAGNTIVFGPGFTAKEGSYMHAYITPNFCPELPESIVAIQNGDLNNVNTDYTSISNDFQSIHEDNDIKVYPNPTNGKVCVDFLNHPYMNAEIFLLDSKGQRIQNLNTQNRDKIDIDLTYVANGIYLIVIRDTDKVMTRKIVKK